MDFFIFSHKNIFIQFLSMTNARKKSLILHGYQIIKKMKKTALITGASKGIGVELAGIFAKNGNNLVLVARSGRDLEIIKKVFEEKQDVSVEIIVKDLSQPNAAKEVYDEVKNKGIEIDYLVNNAGFGDYGEFTVTNWERYRRMIELNVTALTEFCHLYLKDWSARGSGKILNVSSTSAFQPGPMMAVYFATKAYVLHLSEAIGYEVKDKGITVTTLCPGPTDTNFGNESNMHASDLVKNVRIASAKHVAELGYKAMMNGKPVVIEGAANKVIANSVRFAPRSLVTKLSGMIMRRS